jgi:hypothetical protein
MNAKINVNSNNMKGVTVKNKNYVKWAKRFSRLCLWIASIVFLIYVWADEASSFGRNLLRFVAVAEILVLFVDSFCQYIDERESRQLRTDLEKARVEISSAQITAASARSRADEAMRQAMASKRKWDELGTFEIVRAN